MSTKLPRLNVVLEPSIYKAVQNLSKREHVSMSLMARDLIRESLNLYEDIFWAHEAESRMKDFTKKKSLSHRQVWGK